jgi:hypothetical protein
LPTNLVSRSSRRDRQRYQLVNANPMNPERQTCTDEEIRLKKVDAGARANGVFKRH